MAENRLDYTKKLLKKVSFDIHLFRKELAKAYQYLMKNEIEELRNWVISNFGKQYCLQPIFVKK